MPARTRSATKKAQKSQRYYLRCTDVDGSEVTVTYSATGEGTHMRWKYPEPEQQRQASPALTQIDEDAEGDSMMTPPPGGPGWMPQTPVNQLPFDAGSVLRTPMKRPLQRSPDRIGFKGIDFWRGNGVLHGKMEVDKASGSIRYIPARPPGEGADLSRDQVVERQLMQSERIFLEQIDKLMSRKEREEAEAQMAADGGSDSGYEEMDQDVASPERRVRFASQQGVVIIEPTEEEEETIESSEDEQPFRTGPGGVKFSLSGRQLFGQEGTVQVDPTYRHDRRAARLLARKPTEPLDDDANKENDEHLGSVEVNGSSFDVILRPRRSARLALPRPSQMQQPAWGPIAAVTGPVRSPKKTFRRRLGPYGTVLIDPVTFRELTPC